MYIGLKTWVFFHFFTQKVVSTRVELIEDKTVHKE